jgi:hypothetical protein
MNNIYINETSDWDEDLDDDFIKNVVVRFDDPKLEEPVHDKVNSPKHYTSHPSGVECIDITQHYNFCVGNAIKYLWRQGLKSEIGYESSKKQIEDLKKAVWYINREIANLESGEYEQS